jgi:excisionase family DNA binding protein
MTPEKPYRLDAAAKVIGVHRETLRRWIHRGLVSAIRLGQKGVLLIPVDEVRRMTGTPSPQGWVDFKSAAANDN